MTDPAVPFWFQLFSAALGGGLTVKLIDIGYQEILRRREGRRTARRFVDEHLDPILKSAEEVVGKLLSLAREDFASITGRISSPTEHVDDDVLGLIYLFARLWAQFEIFRIEGLSVAIAEDPRGAKLQSFISCLESKRIRIVDRMQQRAIGELLIRRYSDKLSSCGFVEFAELVQNEPQKRKWLNQLLSALQRVNHTSVSQRILVYGIVAHAMVDTLDRDHDVTRDRPSYPSKLTKRSWRDLKYRIFKVYLPEVSERKKYLEEVKGKADKQVRRPS